MVLFYLAFNTAIGLVCIGLTQPVAAIVARLLPAEETSATDTRPCYLDPSALATPSLAISCAARVALHQAGVVETMLQSTHTVEC